MFVFFTGVGLDSPDKYATARILFFFSAVSQTSETISDIVMLDSDRPF